MDEKSLEKDIESLNINENDGLNLYGFTNQTFKIKKPQIITLKLIIERNLNESLIKNLSLNEKDSNKIIKDSIDSQILDEKDLKAKQILKLTHIHLDRENLTEIDNLIEYISNNVTHIYLQHNLIKKIENLEFFTSLRFLLLSNNQITRIENLLSLVNLKMLDLSFNLIEHVDVRQFPKSIMFLDLRENEKITRDQIVWDDYSNKIKNYLFNLCTLNGKELDDSGEEEIDEIEEKKGMVNEFDKSIDMTNEIESLQKAILERSLQRQKNDKTSLEKISIQRKSNLDEIRNSINMKLNLLKNKKKLKK
jgi:hypothetical protein